MDPKERSMWKKCRLVITVVLISLSVSSQESGFIDNVNFFLQQYVSKGEVNYEEIKSNKNAFSELLMQIENIDFSDTISNEPQASLINAYNILVIHQVIQNYPIESPMDVEGFFTKTKYNVGGRNLTLNELENDVLRKEFQDPRYHFVLVCGAVDCPPLADFAYSPENLDEQLQERTQSAINDENFIYEEKGIAYISEIFKWYVQDFGNSSKKVLEYINSFREVDLKAKKVEYYDYDWTLNSNHRNITAGLTTIGDQQKVNLQTFNAGSLLRKGQFDFTLFNSLYTQTKYVGGDGTVFENNRESFYTSLIQVTYGITKSKRFNIGLDINFKGNARSSDDRLASATDVFRFQNNDSTRVGITAVGPRIKWQPLKNVSDFTIQSTFTIPTIKSPEGASNLYWADWNRYIWWNQFFYSKTFTKFQLFTELDFWFRFKRNDEQISHVDLPVSIIASYFVNSKFTVYALAQHNTRAPLNFSKKQTNDFISYSDYTSLGAGLKYNIKSNLTAELLYTNFVRGTNSGIGNSINLGIKWVTF